MNRAPARPARLGMTTSNRSSSRLWRARREGGWSTRGLAEATGLSRMTISRIWRAFGLQPHRTDSFKLSLDPLLIEKVRDIVGLYMNPPDHALVFCVDEKSQIQALDR